MPLLYTVSWYWHCVELCVSTLNFMSKIVKLFIFPISKCCTVRKPPFLGGCFWSWLIIWLNKISTNRRKNILLQFNVYENPWFFCIFLQCLCKTSVISLIQLRGMQYFAFMTLYNPLPCSSRYTVPWLTSVELQGSAANFPIHTRSEI